MSSRLGDADLQLRSSYQRNDLGSITSIISINNPPPLPPSPPPPPSESHLWKRLVFIKPNVNQDPPC